MRNEKLTANFSRSEFACKGFACCGASAPVAHALVSLLQRIRDRVGAPVAVTSGFRCRKHNMDTPGAHPDSYHTLGWAADITTRAMDAAALFDIVQDVIKDAGYGFALLYSTQNFVHIDIRNLRP
jgi:zinc D-Ala-D-Ala carboxypeptidase